jgi:general secretion pathway protein D
VTGSYSATGSGSSNPTNPFQTISRENVGITLNVTPRINEGSRVILDIEQTVSSISDSAVASDVITNERKITTQIMVADGETVVLGGLISDDVQVTERRVPLLGSIPVLGRLFRSESNTIVKKNLMVFIRASIIRDDETLTGATAEKYEYIRNQQAGFNDIDTLMSDKADLPILPTWAEAQKASVLDSEVIQLPAHQRIPNFEGQQP